MSDVRARLRSVLCQAAPPCERISGLYFARTSIQDPDLVERRAKEWIEAATGGNRAAFEDQLAFEGLSWQDFEEGLADVYLSDPSCLPPWGEALLCFLQCQTTRADNASTALRNVYNTFCRTGESLFEALLQTACVNISPRAAGQFAAQLAGRLMYATGPALDFELRIGAMIAATGLHDDLGIDVSLEGWMNRLERFPGLAFVIGTVCANWSAAVTELFQRLKSDWDRLRDQLWHGADPPALSEFRGDVGDQHDGGRSVCLLAFGEVCRVVYKTKDLRCAAAFMDLIAFLNSASPALDLHVRKILCGDGYAWEEFVETLPCEDTERVERFYFRMGKLLRLIQLVEGRDFWLDNLIANGQYPAFIDLETILQPRARTPELSSAEREAWRVLEESVVMTGVVTAPATIGEGIRAEDFGALTLAREVITPIKPPRALESGDPEFKIGPHGYLVWSPRRYIPMLDGQPSNASDYLDQIVAGYRSMQECLRSNASALTSDTRLLGALENVSVRYIWRDTWTCYAILQESLGPLALRDGVSREIALNRLWRSALLDESSKATARIIQHEIQSFRSLDIPLFRTIANRNDLLGGQATLVPDYFEGTAHGRLMQRLHENKFDIQEQWDLFRSCFDSGQHGMAERQPRCSFRESPTNGRRNGNGLDLALEIGDSILSSAKQGSDGDLAWIGLRYDPFHDALSVGLLGPDLLSGTCGVAILFADLFLASGFSRFETAARRALEPALRALESLPDLLERRQESRATKLPCGAFLGIGSQIFALARCSVALGDSDLGHMASSFAASLPVATLCRVSSDDVLAGLAGLLLALTAPIDSFFEPPAHVLNELAAHLRRHSASSPVSAAGYSPSARFLEGLPLGHAGVAMALARAERVGVLREPAESVLPSTTTPSCGTFLAALGCMQAGRQSALVADLNHWFRHDPAEMRTSQLLDALEVALLACRVTEREEFHDWSRIFGHELVRRYEAAGFSWFPDRFAADRHNISSIYGTAAIASALMRLEQPTRFASPRTLS